MEKEELYKKLEGEVLKYLPSEMLCDIKRAYIFADNKHKGQKRLTNEEYITHPLNVAIILTSIKADKETIIAVLLHDTLEDTETTKEEIKEEFGEEVLKLVDGVTKINSLNISTENDYLTSYYKKIIVGMSCDVRVIIIKLADRLHNMRTLSVKPLSKQKQKAKETLEILAPIAHRLGMNKIKQELEDLSLKYLKPDAYSSIEAKLLSLNKERDTLVNDMMAEVSNLLNKNGIKHEIKGRAKSIYSIYRKLDKGKTFNEIYDLLAIRILVSKEQECYLALGIIHSKFKPVPKRFKDYIANPKTNLYQTLHTTVFGIEGNLFEIQIRTYKMDDVAENGIASHWAYKEGKNAAVEMQNITEQKLQFYKSIIELNKEKLTTNEFVDSVKNEVLNNNIYVYTPKGDVIELPKGATPIDFAYRIHSDVGDKTTGAIVNDCIVPLNHKLNNSDIVRITTNKNQVGPSYEWLNFVKTTQAKNKIKSFFNKKATINYIEDGKNMILEELRREKIPFNTFFDKDTLDKKFALFNVKDVDELYLYVGQGKYSPKSVIGKEEVKQEENTDGKLVKPINYKDSSYDIIVGNEDNIKTHIANCCLPLPGDKIIGYITKTNGISIHRSVCPSVKDSSRVIKAYFNITCTNKYYSKLLVTTTTTNNLINDIIGCVTLNNITAESINIISKVPSYIYQVLVLVKDRDELEKLIISLSHIKYVKDVERNLDL